MTALGNRRGTEGKTQVRFFRNPSEEIIEDYLDDGWEIAFEQWVVMEQPGYPIAQKAVYCCRMVRRADTDTPKRPIFEAEPVVQPDDTQPVEVVTDESKPAEEDTQQAPSADQPQLGIIPSVRQVEGMIVDPDDLPEGMTFEEALAAGYTGRKLVELGHQRILELLRKMKESIIADTAEMRADNQRRRERMAMGVQRTPETLARSKEKRAEQWARWQAERNLNHE
jgi:hypothetical protein